MALPALSPVDDDDVYFRIPGRMNGDAGAADPGVLGAASQT